MMYSKPELVTLGKATAAIEATLVKGLTTQDGPDQSDGAYASDE